MKRSNSTAPSCTSSPSIPKRITTWGVIAVQAGQPIGGLPHFQAALAARPDHGPFWCSLIGILIDLGRLDEACRVLEQARRQPVTDGAALENLAAHLARRLGVPPAHPLTFALALREVGKYPEALNQLAAYLSGHPLDAEALAHRAHLLLLARQPAAAAEAVEQALTHNPDLTVVQRNLARVRLAQGRPVDALTAARQAHRIAPDDAENRLILATALGANQAADSALALLDALVQARPDDAEAHAQRALLQYQTGKTAGALADAQRAVALKPHLTHVWFLLSSLLRAADNLPAAIAALQNALMVEPDHVDILLTLGEWHRQMEETDQALALLEKAVMLAPDNANAWVNYGAALQQAERKDEAKQAYYKALAINPQFADVHNNLGVLAKDAERWEEALAYFDQAVALQPDKTAFVVNLCWVLERSNQVDRLRQCLANLPETLAEHSALILARAQLLRRDGALEQARDLLLRGAASVHETDPAAAEIQAVLGDVHDRLGNYPEAFACFQAGNRLARPLFATPGVGKDHYNDLLASLSDIFTPEWTATWTPPVMASTSPVFLVGFPRSGTTLLDSILRSHPSIAVIEEKPVLTRTAEWFRRFESRYPAMLAELSAQELRALQALYCDELGRHLTAADQSKSVFIDKLPLNIAHAGLIYRIFPHARFILALRHPADCVLSCFMHNFKPNAAMANFLTLEDSARFYAQVMHLWDRYRRALPLRAYVIRYEDLIADFTGNVSALLDFLELPWCDEVTRYAETAQRRSLINTPSYHQVIQPIYQRACGRWEHYRDYLEPVLPVIEPWVKYFGYDA
jgi:tetratricopeptide (TPR) repeat protein